MRAVYRQDVKGATLVFERGDDEGAFHFLSGQTPEGLRMDLSNGQSRQQTESPLAVFDAVGVGAADALDLAQCPMFAEEQSTFAAQVGEQRLPRSSAGPRGDALSRGEGNEEAVHT